MATVSHLLQTPAAAATIAAELGTTGAAFDVSAAIPPTSWYGTLLKGIFNFSPATTWLEAIVWVAYVVPTMTIFLDKIHRRSHPKTAAVQAVTAGGHS